MALGAGVTLSEKKRELIELEGQLNRLMPDYNVNEINSAKEKVRVTLEAIDCKKRELIDLERNLKLLNEEMLLNSNARAELKLEWTEANNRQYQQSDKCFASYNFV